MTLQAEKITADEFERYANLEENSDRLLELIDGIIEEKMPTEEHSIINVTLILALGALIRAGDLGRLNVEARHRIKSDNANSLLPDISFTSKARLLPVVTQGAVPHMPDLCIEVKSPTDSFKKLRAKKDYYLANGAQMVWLVFPSKRIIEVYTHDEQWVLNEEDTLTGGNLLPGLSIAVKAVFAMS